MSRRRRPLKRPKVGEAALLSHYAKRSFWCKMLEVSAAQIHSLQGRDADFVALLRHLLHVEAFTHDLALGGIHVTAQITVADGGEDGRIEWSEGPTRTDYFPARFSLFQIKATPMGKAKCKSEVVNRKTGELKPAIEEVIERSGAYIVFGTDLCSPPMLTDRLDSLKEGFLATFWRFWAAPSRFQTSAT